MPTVKHTDIGAEIYILHIQIIGKLKDVHFVYAEGLNMGVDAQQAALAAAATRLGEISAKIAA